MQRAAKLMVAISAAVFSLAGCGGGSNTGNSNDPLLGASGSSANTYPVESAMQSLLTAPHTFVATGSDASGSYALSADFAPQADGAFNGAASKTASVTRTLSQNGQLLGSEQTTEYFQIGPMLPLGRDIINSNNDRIHSEDFAQAALPSQAKVGDGGYLLLSKMIDASGLEGVDLRIWKLQKAANNTAWLCMYIAVGNETDCVRIDTSGSILDYAFVALSNTGTITLLTDPATAVQPQWIAPTDYPIPDSAIVQAQQAGLSYMLAKPGVLSGPAVSSGSSNTAMAGSSSAQAVP